MKFIQFKLFTISASMLMLSGFCSGKDRQIKSDQIRSNGEHFKQEHHSKEKHLSHHHSKKRKCHRITQECVGTKGFVIKKPGYYKLCENIYFSPSGSAIASTPESMVEAAEAAAKIRGATKPILRDYDVDAAKLRQDIDNANIKSYQDVRPIVEQHMQAAEAKRLAWLATADVPAQIAAITISASNVVLDLNGFNIFQADFTVGVVGVFINSPDNWQTQSLRNIAIINGGIQLFTQGAISCNVLSAAENIPPTTNVNGLLFENLNIINNGGFGFPLLPPGAPLIISGIQLDGTFAAINDPVVGYDEPKYYFNVIIESCRINNNTSIAVDIQNTDNLIVKNCEFNNTSFRLAQFTPYIAGLHLIISENVKILNSTFNNTTQFSDDIGDPIPNHITGMGTGAIRNMRVDNCQFNNTSASSFGELLTGCENGLLEGALITNCQFNNPTSLNSLNLLTEGFHCSDLSIPAVSNNGLKFENCQFNNATALNPFADSVPLQVTGVDIISMKNVDFQNCQFTGSNSLNSGASTIGLHLSTFPEHGLPLIENARNLRVKNCTIGDVLGGGSAQGILLQAGTSGPNGSTNNNITLEGNTISHITTLSPSAGVAGILAASYPNSSMTNLFLKDNRVSDVRGSVPLDSNGGSAGIFVSKVTNPLITNNSVSDCLNGIILDVGSANGTVQNNNVDNCDSNGFVDYNFPITSNAYLQNKAFNNGVVPSVTTNYAVNWSGVPPGVPPIASGTLSSYPTSSAEWFNLSLTK